MNNIFFELTIILITAGAISIVVSFFKQPSILAYLLTGLLIGPFGYYQLHQGEALNGLAQIGITLLLFMVGLELDITQLKRIGRTALWAGISQVVVTFLLGFGLLTALGFGTTAASFIALALTFSSTIIVVKLLSEKHDLQSLYGKLSIGIFLVQDFAAILILILLGGAEGATAGQALSFGIWESIIFTLIKAVLLGAVVYWHSVYVFPKVLRFIGKSDELLLIFSLAWALGLSTLVSLPFIGFSLEVGGFLAGIALANSAVHYQISARTRSLRDFFIIIFFIVLGSQLVLNNLSEIIIPAIILTIFVLLVKPFIVLNILGLLGFKPRTSFFSAVTVSQISEFSLILVALGLKMGHLSQSEAGLVTLLGIISIALSSYGVSHSSSLYNHFKTWLAWFDYKKGSAEHGTGHNTLRNHVILAGAHRMGEHVINTLQHQKKSFILVDFNPDIIHHYLEAPFPVICGDITDPHIQEAAGLTYAKLIISTIPDIKDNFAIADAIKQSKSHAKLIVTAQDEAEAVSLYEKEIDYALLPHFIGAMHLAKILQNTRTAQGLKSLRSEHIKSLRSSH